MEEYALTTLDNPYSPFDQFADWYAFDVQKGYNTCAYLARVAMVSDEMSPHDYTLAMNKAIDEILKLNLTGNYRKVTEKDFKTGAHAS